LNILCPNGVEGTKILLYTDAASYVLAASPLLKIFYSCFNTWPDRLAEQFPKAKRLISDMKKVFCKAPYRVFAFKEELPVSLLPPQPVLTCWFTWLKAVEYYSKNLEATEEIICAVIVDIVSCLGYLLTIIC
jgi:hypothetical protein